MNAFSQALVPLSWKMMRANRKLVSDVRNSVDAGRHR